MASTSLEGGAEAAGYGGYVDGRRSGAVRRLTCCDLSRSRSEMHAEATTVQFPGLDGVLPGFGVQRPNDWGLGFEIRDQQVAALDRIDELAGAPTGISASRARSSGSIPTADLALVVLTDRDFGDWAHARWPALSDAVLAEFAAD